MRHLLLLTFCLALTLGCDVKLPEVPEVPTKEDFLPEERELPSCIDGIAEVSGNEAHDDQWYVEYYAYPEEKLALQYFTQEDMRDYVVEWRVVYGEADVTHIEGGRAVVLPLSNALVMQADIIDVYTSEVVPTCDNRYRVHIFIL